MDKFFFDSNNVHVKCTIFSPYELSDHFLIQPIFNQIFVIFGVLGRELL